ncbi:MAG: rod shape-determining protein MreD [Candidatus Kapaibacteriales bacterium]
MNQIRVIEGLRHRFWVKLFIYAGFTASFSFIQLSFSFLISLWGVTPNLLLLLLTWICLAEGPFYGLFAGFIIGIFFDFVSMNVIGINALANTVVAYIVGFFYKENELMNIVRSNKIFLIILIASITHSFIYYLILINVHQEGFLFLFFKYSFGTTFYTMLISLGFFFFRIRKFK